MNWSSLLVNDDDEIREALLDELGIALCHLQNFDPPGIGARSAQECLTLQLETLPDSAERAHALTVVGEHLDHLAARDFARIKKALGCDDDELRAAQGLILSLNPRPGAQYAAIDTRYVVPDVAVRKASRSMACQPQSRSHAAPADQPALRRHPATATVAAMDHRAGWPASCRKPSG